MVSPAACWADIPFLAAYNLLATKPEGSLIPGA